MGYWKPMTEQDDYRARVRRTPLRATYSEAQSPREQQQDEKVIDTKKQADSRMRTRNNSMQPVLIPMPIQRQNKCKYEKEGRKTTFKTQQARGGVVCTSYHAAEICSHEGRLPKKCFKYQAAMHSSYRIGCHALQKETGIVRSAQLPHPPL